MRMLFVSAIALALAAPASAETKSFNLSGFKKIEASAAFKIEFTQGSAWSVSVESKYDNMDQIIVEKVGDTLRITRPQHSHIDHRIEDIVRITAPNLDALDLNAAVSFTAARLDIDNLRIDATAAVNIDIASLRATNIDVHADAATKVQLAGTCNRIDLVLGSATHVSAAGLKCRETHVDAGTAAHAEVYASDKAVAKAAVAASVLVSGKPKDFQKSTDKLASIVGLAE